MRANTTLPLALLVAALAACGGTPPPVQPIVKVSRPPVATPKPPPPPEVEPPPSSEPTVLTAEQKKRDKAHIPRVERFVDAYLNLEPRLLADGKHFVFRSNRDGSWQVYLGEIANPSGDPVRLTNGKERVTSIRPTPDGKYLLFTSDEGADENYHIFRTKLDGTERTDLTPGEKIQRDAPIVPLKKPGTMVYSARANHEPKTRVVVQEIEGAEPKSVYVDPSPSFLLDVSPDATRALLVRVVSPSEQVLLEVNLATGKAARLYPEEGKKANVVAAQFTPDGRKLYVATDEGGESSSLLLLEPIGKKPAVRGRYKETSPATARLDGLEVAPSGDRVAITIDMGNRKEVRLLNARTLKLENAVKAPLGVASGGEFSADGKKFTLVQTTPDRPHEVFLVDSATGNVSPLREDTRPGLAEMPPIDVAIERVPAHDGLQIPVNLYLPRGEKKRLSTIVMVHGGPASSSRVSWNPTVRFFTSLGYAVVEPNIRGSTGFGRAYEQADNREKRLDALKDLESVNRWARAQDFCQYDRMVIFGGSYGGYMVLMALSRQPPLWRAGVDMVGISNLQTFLKSTAQTIRSIFVDEFGDLEKDEKLLGELSPMKDVMSIAAPLFVYQGQNDPRVPRPESDQLVLALRTRRTPVEYMVAADEGHSLDRRDNKLQFMSRVARFLEDSLKPLR